MSSPPLWIPRGEGENIHALRSEGLVRPSDTSPPRAPALRFGGLVALREVEL